MGINNSAIFAAIDMVSAGILGLAFILLVVFCVLAAKTWHWVNIVFLVLSFMAGVSAIFGLTQVYHLRTTAIAEADKWEKQAEQATAEADRKTNGDPTSLTYDPGSLRYIDGVLAREFIGRGRVWPNGQVTADGNNRTFTFSIARPAGFDPLQDVVLFAFAEQDVNGQLHPSKFIGSVRVVGEAAGTVQLEPVALADFQLFAQPATTWSLFEKMPLDRRGIFKRATIAIAESNPEASDLLNAVAANLKDENAELNITQFREVLQSLFLQPQNFGLDPDSIEYEAMIDRFAFDGLTLGTIDNWIEANSATRKSPRFEPSPEETFVMYRFDAPSRPEGYQVDANGSVENDGLYNQLGHAIDPGLHHGGPVTFVKDDTVLVDLLSANGYQRQGTPVPPFKTLEKVTEVGKVYVRQVRDFPFEFDDLRFQSAKTDEEIKRVSQSNVVQEKLIADANAQITERARIINDSTEDNTALKNDLDTINSFANQKTAEVAMLQEQVVSLESNIQTIYQELRDIAIKLSRQAFAGK